MLKKILLTTICFTMFSAAANAAETAKLKIAVVDMDKLFQQYYKTKQTDAVLQQKQGIFQAWAKKLGESRLKLQKEFNILRDAAQNIAFSSTEREKKRLAAQKKYQEFKKKEAELEQYVQQKSREYKTLVSKMHKKLLEEIYTEIRRYAVLKGYNFIFDKSGKTLNTIPVIIYSSLQHDISAEILKKLNRGQPDAELQSDKGSSLR
ncbi:MAG: OmpH family outer membrane protein [Victivallaceae bacterium]|nr:OmpH family outer membrane protein [Victivallaceae bacterium]